MRTTIPKSITLPHDMADFVDREVASGHYASDSEVIRDGIRALQARNSAYERWLREEVTATYDKVKADPSLLMTREDFRAALERDLQRLVSQEAKPKDERSEGVPGVPRTEGAEEIAGNTGIRFHPNA